MNELGRRGSAIDVQLPGVTPARRIADADLAGVRPRVLDDTAQKGLISGVERKDPKLQRRRTDVENQDRAFDRAAHRAVGWLRSGC